MKTHTAFWYTGEKEKRSFSKEQQNIQLKTGCCSSKTPCFLSGLLVADAAEHLESFVLNVHFRFILLKIIENQAEDLFLKQLTELGKTSPSSSN